VPPKFRRLKTVPSGNYLPSFPFIGIGLILFGFAGKDKENLQFLTPSLLPIWFHKKLFLLPPEVVIFTAPIFAMCVYVRDGKKRKR
jgi:hypothetical protein